MIPGGRWEDSGRDWSLPERTWWQERKPTPLVLAAVLVPFAAAVVAAVALFGGFR